MKNTPCYIIVLLLVSLTLNAQTMHSVLETGQWCRVALGESGVYKITASDVQQCGVNMEGCNVSTIRVMGRENQPLPERCADTRPDDLTEMAILVCDNNSNGIFDNDDYVLFYTAGNMKVTPTDLTNDQPQLNINRNLYTDTTYCYLNFGDVVGKRIEDRTANVIDTQNVISDFAGFVYHEKELKNVNSSGRTWYGESFTDSLNLPLELDGYLSSTPVIVSVSLMGHSSELFKVSAFDGNDVLFQDMSFTAASSLNYGSERSRNFVYYPHSSTINMTLKIVDTDKSALMYVDKVIVNYKRNLSYKNGQMFFTLLKEQLQQSQTAVLMDMQPNTVLWDVTNPLEPVNVRLDRNGSEAFFAVEHDDFCGFVAFEPQNAKSPLTVTIQKNQNLHSITDAEMLIITLAKYHSYAEEIATIHRNSDEMNVVVVDVEDIYAEFSAGSVDVTALRDFIRMVYQRGNEGLKYVLLFGKASYDVRNITGAGTCFIPTYEAPDNPCHDVMSYCSDDYFGMLDDDDGPKCEGMMNIAVGRIPVNGEASAATSVNKIRLYNDKTNSYGPWRTQQLFVADVGDTYHTNSELSANLLVSTSLSVDLKKVYFGAYPIVSMASGERIPSATADLTKRLNEGSLVMFYSGHGGVTGLSKRNVFTTSDISQMNNELRQPFVYTATCEFSKFDNPELVSAGEQMLLLPNGGAIAMLTTTRSTYATNTLRMSKALAPLLGKYNDDGKPYRFGDMVLKAKTDPQYFTSNNRVMVLFGDPALRIAMPEKTIKPSDNTLCDTLYKGKNIEIPYVITDNNGNIDTTFNGIAYVKFYPGKTTLVDYCEHTKDFSYFNDVIYSGTVSVTNGQLTPNFVVPRDVDYNTYSSRPRLYLYAYDSIRNTDAFGGLSNFLVLDNVMPDTDNEGPIIEMRWESQNNVANPLLQLPEGQLVIKINDKSGVYHYDYLIGRDIVMSSSLPQIPSMSLNEMFIPTIDDCTGGTITIPLSNLPSGPVTFEVKAWDMCGNSSSTQLEFDVIGDAPLYGVYNYPNPFNETTTFVVSSSFKEDAKVIIEIYNMLGQMVYMTETDTYYGAKIEWNGTSFAGEKLGAGLYPYKVTIQTAEGLTRSVMQKLVITQ